MAGTAGIRVLFAGGGTGGHVFPAIAVAERIRDAEPEAEILFTGTKGKIEATAVPAAGFKFRSIWISGFSRGSMKENILFPLKLIVSTLQAIAICMKFKPKVIVATGGYVSGPSVIGARIMGAKVLLIEPNSYPGITTRLLETRAEEIHLMFKDAVEYLRVKDRTFITGDPVRKSLAETDPAKARKTLGIGADERVLFVVGGSLGAKAINSAIAGLLEVLEKEGVTVIWQTGKSTYQSFKKFGSDRVKIFPFIENMNDAYSAADVVLARAGATTLAELAFLNKPSVLVPLPQAAENHQFKNARSMVDAGAALLVEERNIETDLLPSLTGLLNNTEAREEMINKLKNLGGKDAAEVIARRVLNACRYGSFS